MILQYQSNGIEIVKKDGKVKLYYVKKFILIDGIRMEIENTAMSGGTLKVGYVYFVIDYDEAVSLKSLTINSLLTLNGKLTIK